MNCLETFIISHEYAGNIGYKLVERLAKAEAYGAVNNVCNKCSRIHSCVCKCFWNTKLWNLYNFHNDFTNYF